MNKIFSNKYLLFILRLTVGFVFLYAGALKITDPSSFAVSVSNYQLLNDFFIKLTAVLLPWIEVFAAVLLITGIGVKENSLIISVLLVIFIAAGIISLARGLDIDCGCFGDASVKLGMIKILENILLLTGGIILIRYGTDSSLLRGDS